MFAEADTDGDETLTQSEMDAAMEARMKEHPPDPPPPPRGSEDLVEQLTAAKEN